MEAGMEAGAWRQGHGSRHGGRGMKAGEIDKESTPNIGRGTAGGW